MKVGTKSLLFGAHQFVLHPLFVALAWRRLYGSWPRQVPIWFAFLLHDVGYFGLDNMDGEEGQQHPKRGAVILSNIFDRGVTIDSEDGIGRRVSLPWLDFCAGHSRYYAARLGIEPSKLMRADKYATCLVPLPLYLALVVASGEAWEYTRYHHAYHKLTMTGNRWVDLWRWAKGMRHDWRAKYGPEGTAT